MRLTYATGLVLESIARGHKYGFDVMDVSGLPDGTVYPILRRLQAAGLTESRWEDADEARKAKRPARKYYEITPAGREVLATVRAKYRGLGAAVSPANGGAIQ